MTVTMKKNHKMLVMNANDVCTKFNNGFNQLSGKIVVSLVRDLRLEISAS